VEPFQKVKANPISFERAMTPVPKFRNRRFLFIFICEEMGNMKCVEMIIRPEKLEDVKAVLSELDIHGMTVTMVSGCGQQKGRKKVYRGTEFSINLLPKVKVETAVRDEAVGGLIDRIVETIKTGEIGDGKIFVSNIEQAIKIRTGETGSDAI
jgi:nitrogen regulatory protein P-II 1